MIAFLGLVFAFVFPLAMGLLVISVLAGKKVVLPFLERLALSYLVGTALLTFSMFLFSLVGIKFYFINLFLFWAAVMVILMVYLVRQKISLLIFDTLPFKKVSPLEWVLIVLLALKVAYLYFTALVYPVYVFDAIWNWAFRAKVFFFAHCIPLTADSFPRLGGGMVQYPPAIPLLQAWVAICLQGWNDFLVNLVFPTFFVSMGVVFYYGLKHYTSRLYALFFTFLLTAMPLLLYHGTIGYADMIVSAYFLTAGIYLWRWIKEKQTGLLLLCGFLGIAGAWIKAEGLFFYGIILLVLMLYLFFRGQAGQKIKDLVCYLLFFVPYLVWMIFSRVQGLGMGNINFNPGQGGVFVFRPDALAFAMQETFLTASHGLLFALLLVVLVFFGKGIIFSDKKYLLLMPLLGWAFFLALYVFTQANYDMLFNRIIQQRNFLTFTPLLLYALGTIIWSRYANKSTG